MQAPGFWDDQQRAKVIAEKSAALNEDIAAWEALRSAVEDARHMTQDALTEQSPGFEEDLTKEYATLEARFNELEFAVLFSGEHDVSDCIVSIHAGTGGTEAMDWAHMLLRMILRFAERKGLRAKIVDESRGAEAGIKSATVAIEGRYAYGLLKSEAGVHRLVRISPFDAEKMRHTSFALMEVLPDLGDVATVAIDPKDLRIDTYLSSGHGGQSVQTTYSAVRVTHIPTGIVVSCQNERSQTQNKETAMKILRAKLAARAQAERDAEKQKIRGSYTSAEWGNQARSYVLQPYRLVRDHRTGHRNTDTDAVLDGDVMGFVEAYLRWDAAGRPDRKGEKNEEED